MKMWDEMTNRELYEMTEEEVEVMERLILAEAGIPLTAPERDQELESLSAIRQTVHIPTAPFYEVEARGEEGSPVKLGWFESLDEAEKIRQAMSGIFLISTFYPKTRGYSYSHSREGVAGRATEFTINEKMFPTHAALEAHGATLSVMADKATLINEYKKKFDNYNSTKRETLKPFRDKREAVLEEAHSYKLLISAFSEFTSLTEGNEDIALRFLRKRYSDTEIENAFEWHRRSLPPSFYPPICPPSDHEEEVSDENS